MRVDAYCKEKSLRSRILIVPVEKVDVPWVSTTNPRFSDCLVKYIDHIQMEDATFVAFRLWLCWQSGSQRQARDSRQNKKDNGQTFEIQQGRTTTREKM